MKILKSSRAVEILEGVDVTIKARSVTCKCGGQSLTREFKHIQADIFVQDGKVVVEMWFAKKKALACLRSICSQTVST